MEENKNLATFDWSHFFKKVSSSQMISNYGIDLNPTTISYKDPHSFEPTISVNWDELKKAYKQLDAGCSIPKWEQFEEKSTKVGFEVICIDNADYEDKLVVGCTYIAANWGEDLVKVELDTDEVITVFASRFELAKSELQPKVEHYSLPLNGKYYMETSEDWIYNWKYAEE